MRENVLHLYFNVRLLIIYRYWHWTAIEDTTDVEPSKQDIVYEDSWFASSIFEISIS